MQNKLIKKISPPLFIAPIFDSGMLIEFERKHSSAEDGQLAADKMIIKYLLSRQADFQRNDEAITV